MSFLTAKLLVLSVVSALGYGATITPLQGPAAGHVEPEPQVLEAVAPQLRREGDHLVITGSVHSLFASAGFVGPNRAEKQGRLKPSVDLAAFSRAFDPLRLQIAAARTPPEPPVAQPSIAVAETRPEPTGTPPEPAEEPRIAVAAVDARAAIPALNAITDAAGAFAPMPLSVSADLAYARANTPATEPKPRLTADQQKQLWCLATAIYFEARGEAYRGQVAVAQVVVNRAKHRLYPGTICSVVFQNQHRRNACQFSFACDGIPETVRDRKSWEQAQEIASGVMRGELYLPEVGNATHYHASYVYPRWAPRMAKVTKIGLHIFYRFRA